MNLKFQKTYSDLRIFCVRCSLSISVILTITLALSTSAADVTDYTRLRYDLKSGYDRLARPVQNHTNATTVELSFLIRGFEFDERKSLFTLYAWTIMYWNDEHMKWDPLRYGNITTIHFGAQELWQPDISVYNNYDSDIDHFHNTRVIGQSTGRLVWIPPSAFKVGCTANLRKWPYDSQTCTIILGSWAHSGDELNIELPSNYSKIDYWDVGSNREWKLTSFDVHRQVVHYECCPEPYVDITITLNITRHPSTHTAAVVVPALAIAAAILIAFWIPPGASERLALILFVIVINSMYLYNVYSMIPNNGDEVPLVILYYRDSLLMVSVALVWTICLRYLAASKRTSPVPLPSFIQGFLTSWISKILCLDPRPSVMSNADEEISSNGEDGNKLVSSGSSYQADWAWLAHLLDRVAFLIYLIVYIIFTVALL